MCTITQCVLSIPLVLHPAILIEALTADPCLADRYVVIGAQRDSWGPGVVKAGVGTSLLRQLAKALSDIVKLGKEIGTERLQKGFFGMNLKLDTVVVPSPLCRWVQAPPEYCICQLECWSLWSCWCHRMAGGKFGSNVLVSSEQPNHANS